MNISNLLIIPVFCCFLATLRHSMSKIISFPENKVFRFLTADYWLILLFVELPWMIGSIAREETSPLPWIQFIKSFNDHDLFSAIFGLIVLLTVEFWFFWTPSHLFLISRKQEDKKKWIFVILFNIAVGLILTIPNNPLYGFFSNLE